MTGKNRPRHGKVTMGKMIRVGLSLSDGQVKYLKSECEKIGSRVGLASLCYDVLCERFPRLKSVKASPNPNQLTLFDARYLVPGEATKKARKGARKERKG